MNWNEHGVRAERRTGVVLPVTAVMLTVLVAAVVALATLTGVERRSVRGWVELEQAKLAVRAGIDRVRADLLQECANDRFLVVGAEASPGADPMRKPRVYGFLVDPSVVDGDYRYRYVPMFSTSREFPESRTLVAPDVRGEDERSNVRVARLDTRPWMDPARVEWMPVRDREGRMVARYAFWMEDLQALMDPRLVGNRNGAGGVHERVMFPQPAAGVAIDTVDGRDPVMSQVNISVLDEVPRPGGAAGIAVSLPDRRAWMLSPESSLAAAGVRPPLKRLSATGAGRFAGELEDVTASRIERSLVVGLEAYDEQPLVPFAPGVAPAVAGQPKLNLNRLLVEERGRAVDEMADWVERGLPRFSLRSGGFPDDYLRTLAANALDYADADRDPTVEPGSHVGIDGQPFLSEVVLHLHFQRLTQVNGRWVMRWRFRLFAELWNMGSQPIDHGQARLSYEVNLKPSPVGLGGVGVPFDDPQLLADPLQSTHRLERINGIYRTPPLDVSLRANEYRFYEFAVVDYAVDVEPQFDAAGKPVVESFALIEPEDGMRGLSLWWNGVEVQRLNRLMRDAHGLSRFRTDRSRKAAKACIPGLNYGALGDAVNNMGDPRIAGYLSGEPLGENAYPNNLSPHRRNIRRYNIYDKDPDPRKTRHYGRVLPSEWPDGGHDSATGDFRVTTGHAALPTDHDKWPLDDVPVPLAAEAPQRRSDAGRFFSVTELGRVFDPVMWTPVYPDLAEDPGSGARDTRELMGYGNHPPVMPLSRRSWPEVSASSVASADHGGGNTLRIGRPEHERFNHPGRRAVQLLDLFHVGAPTADDEHEWRGPVVRRHGQININMADRDVLRAMAAGVLGQDPQLAMVADWAHETAHAMRPRVVPVRMGAPPADGLAGAVADAVIRCRPFASPAELTLAADERGRPVFGNRDVYQNGGRLQWSDAAAEEVFARMHDAATVRSRHFRVWVVGQSVAGREERPEVLAEYRRVFALFADPGGRDRDGRLLPGRTRIRVLHERHF